MRKAKKTMRVLILAAAFMMILMMLPIQTVWAADEHAENTNTQATDNGDGTHSLICSECGEAVSTDNHSYDLNGTCTGCGFSAPVKATDGDTTVYYHDADTAFNAMIGKTGTITILRDQRITIAGAHDVDVVINEGVSFTISSFFQVRGRLSGLGTIIVEDEVFFGTYGIVQDVTVMSNMSVGESCQVLSGKFYGIVSNTGKILGGEFYGELINCDITGGGHIIGTVTNTSVPTAFFLGEGFVFTNQGEAIVECTSHIYNSENKCRLCGAAGYSITVTESDPNGSVSADKSAAAPGETVILTIDPDDGYVLCDLIVMCGEEWINTVYSDELGYWFAMPYGNVTVNATFSECNHGDSRHTGGTYKEENTHSFTCTLCNGTSDEKCYGDAAASCINPGICSVCNHSYLNLDNHNFGTDGICVDCGFAAPVSVTVDGAVTYYHNADAGFDIAKDNSAATLTVLRDTSVRKTTFPICAVVINEGATLTLDSAYVAIEGTLSGKGTLDYKNHCLFSVHEGGTVDGVTVMPDFSNMGTIVGGTFNGEVRNTGTIVGGTFNGHLHNQTVSAGFTQLIGTVINTKKPTAFTLGDNFVFTNDGNLTCTSHINGTDHKCRLCGINLYTITVEGPGSNGSLSVDKTFAEAEETVNLTINHDTGYAISELSVTTANGGWIEIFHSSENGYWFAMPYDDVTVRIAFTECNHGNSQHTGGTYKEENTHSFTCTLCNGTAVEKCRGDDTATCIHEGTCSVCNHSYLDLGRHNYGTDGICVDCGFAAPASVTVGDAVQYYHNGSAAYTAAIQAHEAGATDVTVTILRDTDTTVSEWNSHLVVAENATLMLNTTYFGIGGGISGSGTISMRDDTYLYVSDCTIEGVTIDGPLVNNGTIISGTFNGKVTNDRMVTGGCFNGELVNIDLPPAYKKGSVINTSDPTTFALGENFVFTNQGEAIVECTSHIYGKKDHKCRLCGENEVFDVTVTESGSNGAAPYATKETIPYGEDYEAAIKTDSNAWYVNVTKVTVGGEEAAYNYDINTGLLTVETEYITSNMEITAEVYAKVTMNLNGGTPIEKAEDKLEGYKQSDGSYEVPLFYGITGESLANMAKMFVKEGCLLTGAKNAQDNDVDFTRPVENCSIILQWTPVTVSASELTYNGERQKPTVTAGDLVEGTDYTVTYPADMTNAGEKTIVITGKGICGGSTTVNYTINKLDISGAKITVEDSLIYNGKEQTAKITQIKVGDVVLTTEDYTVSGNIGIDAKGYTLTITGKGNCTGSTDADWRIARKTVTVTAENQKIEYGNSISDSAYKAVGLIEEHEITVTLTPSTSEVTDDGTITAGAAVITANGKDVTGNYDVNYLPGLLVITTSDSTKVDEPTNENVEAVERLIGQLPETVSPDDMVTAEAIETAKDAYERLTDHEKSLVEDQAKEKLKSLVAALTDYKIIIGDGGKWTKSTRKSLSFTANGPYGKFTGIKVDGKVVDKNGYESKPGSTIVTLKAEYLETLAVGRHTITVVYTDGEAEGCFEVLAEPVTPATGDDFALIQWITIMCISVCGLIVLVVDRKRRTAE